MLDPNAEYHRVVPPDQEQPCTTTPQPTKNEKPIMVAEGLPLTREAGVELLIQQAPIMPKQHSHSYDDDIGVEWIINGQYIQLTLEPGATLVRWLSWHPAEYPDIKNPFQYLDITKPETWQDLFNELQNHLQKHAN